MKYFPSILCLFLLTTSFIQLGNCPVTGDSGDPAVEALDKLKNRATIPEPEQINGIVTFNSLFNAGDNGEKFSEQDAVEIEGILVKGTQEKGESCNCHTTDIALRDIHVYIAQTANAPLKDCQVVEITAFTKSKHPEWTQDFINNTFAGHHVKVTGWLLYDFKHTGESAATHPEFPEGKLKRHNVWEVHPITSIVAVD